MTPNMVDFHTFEWDLKDPGQIKSIPTQKNGQAYDACSITSETIPPATSFGTGVITIYKSNLHDRAGTSVTTITSETTTELTGSGWVKTGFLQFKVSAVAAASVKVRLTVRMARLGFSV